LKKRGESIKKNVLENAEALLAYEIDMIKRINSVVYDGIETELGPPLYNSLMVDVKYLLEWVLKIEPNNIKANFLLGKMYYLQREVETDYDERNVMLALKFISKAFGLLSMSKDGISQTEIIELEKIYKELRRITEYKPSQTGDNCVEKVVEPSPANDTGR
jgi:uncharacterized protein (DUF2164 family)